VAYDKGNIFNTNVQELYPTIGLPDELDRVVGTSKLDTLYLTLVNEFNLVEHYEIRPHVHAKYHAMEKLKKNSSIAKSEYGELKIKLWAADATLAAAMANRYFEHLNALHQKLQSEGNAVVLQRLEEAYHTASGTRISSPAIANDSTSINVPASSASLQQYQNLIDQYKIVMAAKPPVLLAVEPARPGYYVDRPYRKAIIAAAFFGSLLLGLLMAVLLERRRHA
jgi:hypothetical protein